MWRLKRACHCSISKWRMTQTEMVLIYSLAKLGESACCEKGNLLRAGDATVSHMGPAYKVSSHKHPPWCKLYKAWIIKAYIQQPLCLYQCVLIQYVECLEIWTILCPSYLWYLPKWFWNTFVIIWLVHRSRTVSYQLHYSPEHLPCVFVWFLSAWILKRKTAHCLVHVEVQGASHRTLRLPVLSVPYGCPPLPPLAVWYRMYVSM